MWRNKTAQRALARLLFCVARAAERRRSVYRLLGEVILRTKIRNRHGRWLREIYFIYYFLIKINSYRRVLPPCCLIKPSGSLTAKKAGFAFNLKSKRVGLPAESQLFPSSISQKVTDLI